MARRRRGEKLNGVRCAHQAGLALHFLRLPESRFVVNLPLIGRFARKPQPDAGLVPDRLVLPTRDDIAAGRDPALADAFRLVA